MPAQLEGALRRHALNIVSRLPDNPIEALRVLDYARELVDDFLAVDLPRRPSLVLVRTSDGSDGSRRRKAFATSKASVEDSPR